MKESLKPCDKNLCLLLMLDVFDNFSPTTTGNIQDILCTVMMVNTSFTCLPESGTK